MQGSGTRIAERLGKKERSKIIAAPYTHAHAQTHKHEQTPKHIYLYIYVCSISTMYQRNLSLTHSNLWMSWLTFEWIEFRKVFFLDFSAPTGAMFDAVKNERTNKMKSCRHLYKE